MGFVAMNISGIKLKSCRVCVYFIYGGKKGSGVVKTKSLKPLWLKDFKLL
jgi:hypothetical protein